MAADTKRKHAAASSSGKSAPAGPSSMAKRPARPVAADFLDNDDDSDEDAEDDDDEDDFDDGEDLLAAAQAGRSGAHDNDDEEMDEDSAGSAAAESTYESEADEDGFEVLDGSEDDEQDDAESSRKPSGKDRNKIDLYALPTNEELQALTEVGEQFKSGLVKMKIEEMVASVTPKYTKAKPLETVLRRLRSLVESIEPISSVAIKDAQKTIKKRFPSSNVSIPFGSVAPPKKDAQYSLGFEAPAALQLVGSWPLHVAAKRPSGLDVDVALVMPSSLFQEKDHLNYRYFHKRAFYLAVVAAAISTSKELKGVTVSFGGDERTPMLVLSPPKDTSDIDFSKLKAVVRIHLAHQPDLFPPARLAPSRNNVRTAIAGEEEGSSSSAQPATPHYNAAILADSLRAPHMVYLHATAKACPAFTDAALLLRVWAFQRGFGSGTTSDGSVRRLVAGTEGARFVLTMVLAHLLHGEEQPERRSNALSVAAPRAKLFNTFSSYQLFRGCIDWLATHDFAAHPVFMKSAPEHGLVSKSDRIAKADFAAQYDRVLVDPTGSVNLLDSWSAGAVDLLQHEARLTFALLDDEGPADHFAEVFLRAKSCPTFTFDEVASLRLQAGQTQQSSSALDHGSATAATLMALQATLRRGLATRCHFTTALQPAEQATQLRPLSSPNPSSSLDLELGLLYRGTSALRIVEHGPLAEDVAASEEFRNFWGDDVAELRRFKDGRISYSVVWEVGAKMEERAGIPRRIVRHVVRRHHGEVVMAKSVHFEGEGFTGLLEAPESISKSAYLAIPETRGGFQLVQSAFDGLVKQLRGLSEDDVPLSLITAAPCSSALRSTSTFIPAPLDVAALGTPSVPDCASWLPVHDVVLTFESSGKWPDDLEAIQGMKVALLERVASSMLEKTEGLYARVAFDGDAAGAGSIQDEVSLELILASGFAFRLRIHHDRERVLLERIMTDRFATPAQRAQATQALSRHRSRFVHAPAHHARIAALVHRFPALGETTRLLKRWVRAHWLDGEGHVPEEALELLAASVFVVDTPLGAAPSTGKAGFIAALRRLAGWDVKAEPLLLAVQAAILASDQKAGVNGAETAATTKAGAPVQMIRFPAEKRDVALEAFKEARKQDPSMAKRAWFIVTDDEEEEAEAAAAVDGDASLSIATMRGPTAATAHALQTLARGGCALLASVSGDDDDEQSSEVVRALFKPSVAHFDFLIHLDRALLSRYAPHHLGADESVWSSSSSSSSAGGFKNKPSAKGKVSGTKLGHTPRPGFDAASSFVALLRSLYADSLRLYYDENGGDVVGGLWNPSLAAVEGRRFKARVGFNAMPVEGGKEEEGEQQNVRLNVEAVMAEIERLGEGLVTRVERSR